MLKTEVEEKGNERKIGNAYIPPHQKKPFIHSLLSATLLRVNHDLNVEDFEWFVAKNLWENCFLEKVLPMISIKSVYWALSLNVGVSHNYYL